MRRLDRHNALRRLVEQRTLSTQAGVAAALRDGGYDVLQTSVSRDLAALRLVIQGAA